TAIAFSSSPYAMAPWGGKKGTFGTNPIAFGCPRENDDPLVIDMSLSKVARGKIKNAQMKGETSIPEGWALDKDGNPTTDPAAAVAGTMIPLGDAKGAALALMVEILSASINGAHHGFEASSFFTAEGEAPGIGQSCIVFDPKALTPGFAERVETLFSFMLAQDGVRLPGARRFNLREEKRKNGIDLPDNLYKDLQTRAGIQA
ncbi:MAG: Ldh family oxidoreductase, partial [Mailhella sp.]|nr:Ldh family oxidoreductase [Mailhella sp.]